MAVAKLMGLEAEPEGDVWFNLPPAALIEAALERDEGVLAARGALVVDTSPRTGRSARDKFIVDEPSVHDLIAWGEVNQPIAPEVFDVLYERVSEYLSERSLYVFDGYAGVRPEHAKGFRIICELASQAFFANQMLRKPDAPGDGTAPTDVELDYTLLVAPGYTCVPERDGTRSDAAIMIDFATRRVVIAGTRYSGEIKKAVFSIMNYELPRQGILPMHCSANMGDSGSSAVFFGLSGTGKTTLSADPQRRLIGDDEHGWADDMVFNFEDGCYAKCIDLTREREPQIYDAIRFGAMVENVVIDPFTRQLDFHDASLTENTRAAYPLDHIDNAVLAGRGPLPSTVIFLTADAFGVLPPIAKLSIDQAMYYFLSGYTSKVAGTELGIDEPVPTFSTCFGEPFLPLDPVRYALMLKEKVLSSDAEVFLMNTGWNGRGERMPLHYTRAMVDAAINGEIDGERCRCDSCFGLAIPESVPGCPSELLDPRSSWDSEEAYHAQAKRLADMFAENFEMKYTHMPREIREAGPRVR